MKKIILLILCLAFLISCNFVQPPVQDLRESGKYLYLPEGKYLIQKISNINKGFNGILLLISGSAEEIIFEFSSTKKFNNIFDTISIKDFTGNVRQTTLVTLNNKISDNQDLWLRISYKKGTIYFGYKIYDDIFFSSDLLTLNSDIIEGNLYYKSIYSLNFFDIFKQIFKNILNNKIFFIFYFSFLIFLIIILLNNNLLFKLPFLKKYSFSANKTSIIKIFISGIIIRIIIMPFFVHHDFISGIWVPFQTTYNTFLFYLSDTDAWTHIINQLLHLPIVSLSRYIFPELYKLWTTLDYDYALNGLYNFTSLKSIYFILFILKFQFLIADIIAGILLMKIFSSNKHKISALKLWFFNPVSIYVMYMISRFEIYTIILLLITIIFFIKEKYSLGFLFLGFAAVLRQYPILFLPFVLIVISKNYKNFIKYALITLLPFLIFNKSHNFLAFIFNYNIQTTSLSLAPNEHTLMFFYYQLKNLVLFFFLYMLGLLYLNNFKNRFNSKNVWQVILLFFFIFYSSSNFEPQFGMWIIPFLVIAYAYNKISIIEIIIFTGLFFSVVVLQWDKSFTVHLAMPIYPDLVLFLPSIERIINLLFPTTMLNKIVESFWVALNFWLIYKVLSAYQNKE